jgi:DNA-binding MarR family transcriptional regulator
VLVSKNLEAELVISIINMQSKIQKSVGAALTAHGIGLSEYLVLNQLYIATNQKMRRSDLAEKVGLSPSGVTRLLNPMEKIGLIEKEGNPRDARVSLVILSEAGKKITEEAKVSFAYASSTLFESLDKKRLSLLSDMLKVVTK